MVLAVVPAILLGFRGSALAGEVALTSAQRAEQANLALIHAPSGGKSCAGTKIAILDSGVAAGNPHLTGEVLPGWNALDHSTRTSDPEGHGTKVAGVIAGHAGLTGICARARILPVVVWSKTAEPSPTAIAAGIRWAVAHRAGVINISIAGGRPSSDLRGAVADAIAHDVVVIAAAGNTGGDVRQYPAAYPGVLAVSGTDSSGTLTSFSTFGDWIGIAAPATRVLTTTPGGAITPCDGTSFAAPLVAAAAALVRTQHPGWPAARVVRQLEQTADDAGPLGVDPAFGHGILDVAAALGLGTPAASKTPGSPDAPSAATPVQLGEQLHATFAPEGDVDWYVLDVTRPQGVDVVATSPRVSLYRSSSPILDVFGPGLRQLAHRDARYDGSPGKLDLRFPASTRGRYYVRVSNAFGSRGSYSLGFATAPLGQWAAWEDIPNGVEGQSVAVGDVNGDGRADVLMTTTAFVSSPYAGQLLLYEQRADGTLAAPVVLPRAADFCCGDVAIGRLDGRIAVAATLGANGVEVFRERDGVLGRPTLVHTSSAATRVRFRGGRLVIGTVADSGSQLLGHTTTFVPGCEHAAGIDAVATGDVNGDGLADEVCAGPFGLIVTRARSAWSAPGAWVAGARGGQIRFARPIEAASLSARTVRVLDAHGNHVAAPFSFDAATDSLTVRAPRGTQIRLAGIRDRTGDAMPLFVASA